LNLIASGIDPNIPNKKGHFPLQIACKSLSIDTIKHLLDQGADPTVLEKNSDSILTKAVQNPRLKTSDIIKIMELIPNSLELANRPANKPLILQCAKTVVSHPALAYGERLGLEID